LTYRSSLNLIPGVLVGFKFALCCLKTAADSYPALVRDKAMELGPLSSVLHGGSIKAFFKVDGGGGDMAFLEQDQGVEAVLEGWYNRWS